MSIGFRKRRASARVTPFADAMSDPIRIYHGDSADEAKARHETIVKRLVELGPEQVKLLLSSGGLPTQWNPIIYDWLKGGL